MDQSTVLQLAADEADARAIRHHRVEVLDYQPSSDKTPALCPPGSVTVFVAEQGAAILEQLRAAVISGDGSDAELAGRFKAAFDSRSRVSYYRAWRMLSAAPAFAELRYGGRTLAKHIFPPNDLGVAIISNPYNGGELEPDALTLVEHRMDDIDYRLDALALRHFPPLTDAERTALTLVPRDQLELNLAPHGDCCDNATDVLQAVVAATVTLACFTVVIALPQPELHLDPRELERLGPARSARKLLDIRREALIHNHP